MAALHEDMIGWCLALEEKVGHKQGWHGKYRRAWQKYLDIIGLKKMLELIEDLHFRNVEYLMTGQNGRSVLAQAYDDAIKKQEKEDWFGSAI